jgi:glycosyltransferase involved in cell wall biosynthesis
MPANRRVTIVQTVVKQYRRAFFEGLKTSLENDGIEVVVIHSNQCDDNCKSDNIDISNDLGHAVDGRWLFGKRLFLQNILRDAVRSDLVVVEQANKLMANYPLLLSSRLGLKRVAFWGHGYDRQATSEGTAATYLKRITAKSVNWWFAYTQGTADFLAAAGVSPDKITVVQNTIDTTEFTGSLKEVPQQALQTLRKDLRFSSNSRVGLFCGALYKPKLISFLIASAAKIHERLPDFRLIIIGSGPDQPVVEEAAAKHAWIHFVGPKFGEEKALYFRLAEVFLMPGLVGLAIVDAFTAGLPVLTTDIPIHSPEIEYLQNGLNGIMTEPDVLKYANGVTQLLNDREAMKRMRCAALSYSQSISMSEMIARFHAGVVAALQHNQSQLTT